MIKIQGGVKVFSTQYVWDVIGKVKTLNIQKFTELNVGLYMTVFLLSKLL